MSTQPKPDSKKYNDLISEISKGTIKVPKFQRDFVWTLDKTAGLLDSILKGYPIGTFILWQTNQRINEVKNIGNLVLPDIPEGLPVQYVLDGQQRITSLYAAYLGAKIQKSGEKKITDYKDIVVNLSADLNEDEDQVITVRSEAEECISLHDVLHFDYDASETLRAQGYDSRKIKKISEYSKAFSTYDFSTVTLRKDDIDSAIDVFTRINTGGQVLTLFEIMSAKTYDEGQSFDMQSKWDEFRRKLKDIQFDNISTTVVLQLLSLVLSESKECKRKTILNLSKSSIIEAWPDAISAIEETIDYFRTVFRIPVSQLLPYDTLIVPFAYFFYTTKAKPNGVQRRYLEELFWRSALSMRYSSATESKLAQDVKRVDQVIAGQRPSYSDIRLFITSAKELRDTNFSSGNAICKSILCVLAYQEPKDLHNNAKVLLDNSHLKIASSKNYHHFFPRGYLAKNEIHNANSIANITLVSADLNKNKIRAKAPSVYVSEFEVDNPDIGSSLRTHLIDTAHAGIIQDDYETFLNVRSEALFAELSKRLDPDIEPQVIDEVHEIISSGEGQHVEFKSTLRYDVKRHEVNKKLEYVIVKTVAAFMNSDGGNLFIGVDDGRNSLGLQSDFDTLKKPNLDGFELHLIAVLKQYIGEGYFKLWKLSYPTYDGQTICRVNVTASNEPIITKFEGSEDFYVRKEGSSQPLNRADQNKYVKDHWGY